MRIGDHLRCDRSGQAVEEWRAVCVGERVYHPDFVPACKKCGREPTRETQEEFGFYDGVLFHHTCADPSRGVSDEE
jgi:hypothetical protein